MQHRISYFGELRRRRRLALGLDFAPLEGRLKFGLALDRIQILRGGPIWNERVDLAALLKGVFTILQKVVLLANVVEQRVDSRSLKHVRRSTRRRALSAYHWIVQRVARRGVSTSGFVTAFLVVDDYK